MHWINFLRPVFFYWICVWFVSQIYNLPAFRLSGFFSDWIRLSSEIVIAAESHSISAKGTRSFPKGDLELYFSLTDFLETHTLLSVKFLKCRIRPISSWIPCWSRFTILTKLAVLTVGHSASSGMLSVWLNFLPSSLISSRDYSHPSHDPPVSFSV